MYRALFEGLTPQQKARRTIRAILNVPPDGWDSPAKRTDGTEFVSEHGTTLSWDQVLETYLRGLVFRDKAISSKFEPGVARIAYGELGVWPEDIEDFRTEKPESRPLGQFRSILHMLSGDAHVNEYDFDLNGLKYAELVERFGKSSAEADADDTEDTGVLNYRIVHIPDFETAQEYAKYTNHWCVCEYRNYFNRYTARGKNTFYMLFAPGFDDMEDVHGENYPKDEYGLSVIGPMIAPDGSVEYCCVRRNHEGGMGDHALTEKELSRLLGRPVRAVLPHIENESAKSITERVKAQMARGMKPEDIYGSVDGRPWENATVYRQKDGTKILVDNSTMLPLVDYELDSWGSLDERAIQAEVAVGTNVYDDDMFVTFLIRHDGSMYAIGATDMEARDEYDPLYYDVVSGIYSSGITGLYHVRLDNGERCDEAMMYLPEDAGVHGVTDLHEEITVYAADGLVVCDPDSGTLSSGEGDLEIFRMYPDGTRKVLLGYDVTASVPNHVFVCDDGMPAGKVNILYDDSDNELRLIHDGEDTGTGIYASDFDYIDNGIYPGIVWVEKEDESGYCVYSIKGMEAIADNLPGKPDENGIFEDSDGKKNLVTGRGVLLDRPADQIELVGGLRTPVRRNVMRKDKRGVWHTAYFADATMPDGEHFIDIDTGDELYGMPIPKDAYPYTEKLYIGHIVEGNTRRLALFTLDGERTSCTFDKLNSICEIMERCDGNGNATGYNLINPDTGKELFPFWLEKRPEFLTGSLTEHGIDRGLIRCTREDGKKTIVMMLTPVETREGRSPEKIGNSRFDITGVGWHDHFEQVPGCPFAVLIHDSSTGEMPVEPKKYLTVAYDFRTGKHTGRHSGPKILATLRELCSANGLDLTNRGIARAIAMCPDWTEWIDAHIDNDEADEQED